MKIVGAEESKLENDNTEELHLTSEEIMEKNMLYSPKLEEIETEIGTLKEELENNIEAYTEELQAAAEIDIVKDELDKA